MRCRFYFDENFPVMVAPLLRGLGHDALTVQEAGQGNRGIGDPQVLQYAIVHQRAVVTFDRDFSRLHRQTPQHFGILLCSKMSPENLAERIHAAVLKQVDLRGQFLRITRPG